MMTKSRGFTTKARRARRKNKFVTHHFKIVVNIHDSNMLKELKTG